MTIRRSILISAVVVLAVASGGVAYAKTRPAMTAFSTVLYGSSLTTTTGPNDLTGPTTIGMAATGPGLQVRGAQGNTAQPFQVFDYLGAPIAGVASAGGMWVAGDNFRILGSDIFNADLTLWKDGSVTIGQRVGGPTLFGGRASPNTTPPPSSHGYHAGDRYLQTTAPYTTWVWNGNVWAAQ